MKKIGFVGVGIMGKSMVRNLRFLSIQEPSLKLRMSLERALSGAILWQNVPKEEMQ